MKERNIHKIMLEQYARRLYVISGQMNLYVYLCCKEHPLNIEKLKSDIKMIRDLTMNVEIEMANI